MRDIIERLRDISSIHFAELRLCADAAVEIEQLRSQHVDLLDEIERLRELIRVLS